MWQLLTSPCCFDGDRVCWWSMHAPISSPLLGTCLKVLVYTCSYMHMFMYECIHIYGDVYTHLVRARIYLCNPYIRRYVFKSEWIESTAFSKSESLLQKPLKSQWSVRKARISKVSKVSCGPNLGQAKAWPGKDGAALETSSAHEGLGRGSQVCMLHTGYAFSYSLITGVSLTHLEPGGTEAGSGTIIAKSMGACADSRQRHAVPAVANFVILSAAVNTAASMKKTVIMDSRHAIHILFCLKHQQKWCQILN